MAAAQMSNPLSGKSHQSVCIMGLHHWRQKYLSRFGHKNGCFTSTDNHHYIMLLFVCLSPPEWFLFNLCVKYCIVTSSCVCVCCSFSPRPANLSACDSFWPLQKGQTRKGRSLDESWASDWLMAEWWKQCQGSRPRYRSLKIHGEFLHTHTDFTDWLTVKKGRSLIVIPSAGWKELLWAGWVVHCGSYLAL